MIDFDGDQVTFNRDTIARGMAKSPNLTIGEILKGLNADLFRTVNDFASGDGVSNLRVRGLLNLSASNLQIKVETVANTVDDMKSRILSLLSDGKIHTRTEIIDDLFSDIDFDADAGAKANFDEAMRIVYDSPGVRKITKSGEVQNGKGRVYSLQRKM